MKNRMKYIDITISLLAYVAAVAVSIIGSYIEKNSYMYGLENWDTMDCLLKTELWLLAFIIIAVFYKWVRRIWEKRHGNVFPEYKEYKTLRITLAVGYLLLVAFLVFAYPKI